MSVARDTRDAVVAPKNPKSLIAQRPPNVPEDRPSPGVEPRGHKRLSLHARIYLYLTALDDIKD